MLAANRSNGMLVFYLSSSRAFLRIGAVALKTLVRQEGTNLGGEANLVPTDRMKRDDPREKRNHRTKHRQTS